MTGKRAGVAVSMVGDTTAIVNSSDGIFDRECMTKKEKKSGEWGLKYSRSLTKKRKTTKTPLTTTTTARSKREERACNV